MIEEEFVGHEKESQADKPTATYKYFFRLVPREMRGPDPKLRLVDHPDGMNSFHAELFRYMRDSPLWCEAAFHSDVHFSDHAQLGLVRKYLDVLDQLDNKARLAELLEHSGFIPPTWRIVRPGQPGSGGVTAPAAASAAAAAAPSPTSSGGGAASVAGCADEEEAEEGDEGDSGGKTTTSTADPSARPPPSSGAATTPTAASFSTHLIIPSLPVHLEKGLWFLKRTMGGEGMHIQLLSNPLHGKIRSDVDYVLQKEVKTGLFQGYKGDWRVFCVVVYQPARLRGYVFNRGLYVPCFAKYDPDDLDKFAHISNRAIQSMHPDFSHDRYHEVAEQYHYGPFSPELFLQIKEIWRGILNAVVPDARTGKNSGIVFYGIDIIIDERLKVWLLEVIMNPCLSFYGPRVFDALYRPMIRSLVDIAVIPLVDPRVPEPTAEQLVREDIPWALCIEASVDLRPPQHEWDHHDRPRTTDAEVPELPLWKITGRSEPPDPGQDGAAASPGGVFASSPREGDALTLASGTGGGTNAGDRGAERGARVTATAQEGRSGAGATAAPSRQRGGRFRRGGGRGETWGARPHRLPAGAQGGAGGGVGSPDVSPELISFLKSNHIPNPNMVARVLSRSTMRIASITDIASIRTAGQVEELVVLVRKVDESIQEEDLKILPARARAFHGKPFPKEHPAPPHPSTPPSPSTPSLPHPVTPSAPPLSDPMLRFAYCTPDGTRCGRAEAELGSGGSGRVFRCVRVTDGVKVAIKQIIMRQGHDDVATLRLEAEQLIKARHPAIVRSHESFEFRDAYGDEVFALVMELCDSRPFFEAPREPLGREAFIEAATDLTGALWHLHDEMHAYHGDVKPANILAGVGKRGKRLRLTDFGLSQPAMDHTTMRPLAGTLAFLPPEVHAARGLVVGGEFVGAYAADVYAAGLVLYEWVTGRAATSRSTVPGLNVTVLGEMVREVPAEAAELVGGMLEADPTRRLSAGRAHAMAAAGSVGGVPRGVASGEAATDGALWAALGRPGMAGELAVLPWRTPTGSSGSYSVAGVPRGHPMEALVTALAHRRCVRMASSESRVAGFEIVRVDAVRHTTFAGMLLPALLQLSAPRNAAGSANPQCPPHSDAAYTVGLLKSLFSYPPAAAMGTPGAGGLVIPAAHGTGRPSTLPRHGNLVLAFGGYAATVVGEVVRSGPMSLRVTDNGYFGVGLYTTPQLGYALQYSKAGADGLLPAVLFAVPIGNAYPVTQRDYRPHARTPKDGLSRFHGATPTEGIALMPGFDAHVAAVRYCGKEVDFQAAAAGSEEAMEIVVSERRLVPVAVVWARAVAAATEAETDAARQEAIVRLETAESGGARPPEGGEAAAREPPPHWGCFGGGWGVPSPEAAVLCGPGGVGGGTLRGSDSLAPEDVAVGRWEAAGGSFDVSASSHSPHAPSHPPHVTSHLPSSIPHSTASAPFGATALRDVAEAVSRPVERVEHMA